MNSSFRESGEAGENDDSLTMNVNRDASQKLSGDSNSISVGLSSCDQSTGVVESSRKITDAGCHGTGEPFQASGNDVEVVPNGANPQLQNSVAQTSGAGDNDENDMETASHTDKSNDQMDQMEKELAEALQMVFESQATKRKLEEECTQLRAGYSSIRSENEELVNDMQEILGENEELVTQLNEHMRIEEILADENHQLKEERESLLENLEKAQEVRMQPDEAAQKVEAIKEQLRRKVNFMTAEKMDLESQIKQLRFELGEAHERAESIDRDKQLIQMQLNVSNRKLRRCTCNVRLEHDVNDVKSSGPSHWREIIHNHLEANASPEVLHKHQLRLEQSGTAGSGRMRRRASLAMGGFNGNGNTIRESNLNNALVQGYRREIQSVSGNTLTSPPSLTELPNSGGAVRQRRRMSLSAGISMGIEAMRGSTSAKPPAIQAGESRNLSLSLPPITPDVINLEEESNHQNDEPQLPSTEKLDQETARIGAAAAAVAETVAAASAAFEEDPGNKKNDSVSLEQKSMKSSRRLEKESEPDQTMGRESRQNALSQQKQYASFNTETPTELVGNCEGKEKSNVESNMNLRPARSEDLGEESETDEPSYFETSENSTVSGLSLDSTLVSAAKRSLEDFQRGNVLQKHIEEEDAVSDQSSNKFDQSIVGEGSVSSSKSQKAFLTGFGFRAQRKEEQTAHHRKSKLRGSDTVEAKKPSASSVGTPQLLKRLSRRPQGESEVETTTTRAFWKDEQSSSSSSSVAGLDTPKKVATTTKAAVARKSVDSMDIDKNRATTKEGAHEFEGIGTVDESVFNVFSSFTNERWGHVAQNGEEEFNVKNLDDKATEGMLLVPREEEDVVFEGWG